MSTETITWIAEATDTMGGDANYSWVDREEFILPANATPRQIVMAGKKALGWTGTKCRTTDYSEGYELRPIGLCQVMFILPSY